MSGSHKEFPKKAVGIQLGLAAFVGLGFLVVEKPAALNAMTEKVTKPIVAAAAKVLAPIGKVEVKEASAGAAARTGEEVYASGCGTCHDGGIAGAPKIDDKATWETRLSGGFTALVASAINGKGGMPARGGNPDNTDSEMELAVSHMIKKAGIELVAKSAAGSAAAPAPVKTEEKMATKTEEKPVAEPKAAVMEKTEEPKAAAMEKAEEPKAAAMEKTEEPKATVMENTEEPKAAAMEKAEEPKAAAMEKTEEPKAAAMKKVEEPKAEIDLAAGEAIYKDSCFACHDHGVAGSPKTGDKEAWVARLEKGNGVLYKNAINGIGAMPAKGGNTSIADEDIKAAVAYMLSVSQ